MSKKADELQPIIVKKIKKSGGGHHGGAWKVAYADFVTAMMAFFLLLWLLNVTTEEEKNLISSYFDPTPEKISSYTSGAGGVLGGLTMTSEGAMADNAQPLSAPQQTGAVNQGKKVTQQVGSEEMEAGKADIEALKQELEKREDEAFEQAKKEMEETMQNNPELAGLAENLAIDVVPEGMRIQIIDQDGKPMFPSGSAEMYGYTKDLMKMVAGVINTMPNNLSIRGHTDAHKFGVGAKYTNWELSADRANASRRVLIDAGVSADRTANVVGKADKDPFIAEDPMDARNRRISIILLRENLEDALARGALDDLVGEKTGESSGEETKTTPHPAGTTDDTDPFADNNFDEYPRSRTPVTPAPDKDKPYQKTPGAVYFP